MAALASTHLYGRHLVLEWADASRDERAEGADAAREKARRDAATSGLGGAGGPRKKGKHLKF